jgi:uncharacterized membrane protein
MPCNEGDSALYLSPPSRIVNKFVKFALSRVVAGLLVLAPIYLAGLLMLKAIRSFSTVLAPLGKLLPAWLPGAQVLSLLFVLTLCFLTGLAFRTRMGRAIWNQVEKLFQKIPGYRLVRSLTHRLADQSEVGAWRPALVEMGAGLVLGFIIEELYDCRLTVFVPSVPAPFTGAVYILSPTRVHLLHVPFTQAIRVVSRWGSGAKDLVAATELKEDERRKVPQVSKSA